MGLPSPSAWCHDVKGDHCVRKTVPLRTARPPGHLTPGPPCHLAFSGARLPTAATGFSALSLIHSPLPRQEISRPVFSKQDVWVCKEAAIQSFSKLCALPSLGGKVVRAGQKAAHNFQSPTKGDGRHAGMGLNYCGQKYGLGAPCPH